jgi:hypothetical protein
MKHKTKKIQKPSPSEIVHRLQTNPLYLASILVFENFSDDEITEYASACSAVLGVLVSWAKRATFGLANMDDLKNLFFTPETPIKVRAFFVRAIGLTMGKKDDNGESIS